MPFTLDSVHPPVDRSELPDRIHYRWTDEAGTEVRFRAADADELGRRGLDALVEARRETGQHRHDGGREQDYTRYPTLYLHVEAPPGSDRWTRAGKAGGMTVYEGESGGPDDTELRQEAEELHQHALAWCAHAMNLEGLASDMGDAVRDESPTMERHNISIDRPRWSALEEEADRLGLSVSAVIRMAVDEYIGR